MEEQWGESVRTDLAPDLFLIPLLKTRWFYPNCVELAATSHFPGFVPAWQSPSSLLSYLIQRDLSQVRLDASACNMFKQWFMMKREDCFLDHCFIFGSSPLIISLQAGMRLPYKQILVRADLRSTQAAPCLDWLAETEALFCESWMGSMHWSIKLSSWEICRNFCYWRSSQRASIRENTAQKLIIIWSRSRGGWGRGGGYGIDNEPHNRQIESVITGAAGPAKWLTCGVERASNESRMPKRIMAFLLSHSTPWSSVHFLPGAGSSLHWFIRYRHDQQIILQGELVKSFQVSCQFILLSVWI